MKRKHLIILLALLLMPVMASAQKKKTPTQKKAKTTAKKPVVEEPEEDPRIMEMLEVTQQVVFIDSVVVDKKDFLSAYQLNAETGRLQPYNDFFKASDGTYNTVYLNELGNKCYFSHGSRLYTSDLLGSEWSEPVQLEGFGSFDRTNYPFMMTDGTTFYFAAMGEQSLGGLDIYRTRYDSESGRFLTAENIGMPFNSEANDYMYAIDEIDSIGYFATDRRQQEGKVCIYIFIPTQSRQTYDIDELGEERVRSLARIDRIRDTWGNGKARKQALARLEALRSENQRAATPTDPQVDFIFTINEQLAYNHYSDFRVEGNARRFQELQDKKQELKGLKETLSRLRLEYASAGNEERSQLSSAILADEQQLETLELSIREIEKSIRNSEIQSFQ